jgi:hypothetical protein
MDDKKFPDLSTFSLPGPMGRVISSTSGTTASAAVAITNLSKHTSRFFYFFCINFTEKGITEILSSSEIITLL